MGPLGGGGNYTHDLFTEAAIGMLRSRTEGEASAQPWFMYLSWTDPHAGGWSTTNAEEGNPVPDDGDFGAMSDWPLVEQDHASVIQNFQDRDVGRILDLLDELGLTDSTVIFFASDNGASNEGGSAANGFHSYQFFNSSGPLQGCKRSLYEGGIRSPSIVSWPGRIAAGGVSSFPWYFPDFLPTALDLANAAALTPAAADGISIVPTLLGHGQERTDDCMYFEFCTSNKWGYAARIGNLKAVALSSEAPLELYDLSVDIGETNDLALSQPDLLTPLAACLEAQHRDSPQFPRGDGNCTASR
uniref:Sulfatase N-terminal domain-containing protein n=1 Tax=Florenciella parvula TaxID=236787 RepID=A0A7S2BZK4_9STRA|mmetsp:Transcript_2262/g.5043  ORF Transcript_2262/g.5043 Transcript_2262/m.5043 type:complete len:301 (+) Transcript_2262:2-904(+)